MSEAHEPAALNEPGVVVTDAPARAHGQLPPLDLQPDAPQRIEPAARYHVNDLLRYHDRAFVRHAYAALCGRAPDHAELTHTLNDLRAGRRSKIEIITDLLAARTSTPQADERAAPVVTGLTSPLAQWLTRLPVLGYVLRLVRAVTRLPAFMRHQQQFEVYALAQQQRIADYINEAVAPGLPEPGTLNELVESVMLLSDSLLDLAARHADLQAQADGYTATLTEHAATIAGHAATLAAHGSTLSAQAATLSEHAAGLRAHAATSAAQDATLTAQAATLTAHEQTLAAQQEFLLQEQHVIVEAQKAVLTDLQTQLHELAAAQQQTRAELATQLARLQALAPAIKQA